MTATSDSILALELPKRPYPGLRAFREDEWSIFFGRERMIDEVTRTLINQRFVVVHGDSGCGKSSLIKAGVLPRLKQEHSRAGANWQTAVMEPGESPLDNLSRALTTLAGDNCDPEAIRRILLLGLTGLPHLQEQLNLSKGQYVCLLVDQFEELFAFVRDNPGNEAGIFVDVLVGLQTNPLPNLHVILTMRSEFLGACARYQGLAEAINATQYLLPRMGRNALLRAVCEPARLFNGEVSRGLADKLISDTGGSQDHLPLIQHGLLLLYRRKNDERSSQQTRGLHQQDSRWTLDLDDLPTEVGLASLLSKHADQIADTIRQKYRSGPAVLESVFRALTDIDADGNAIRRRQTVAQLAKVAGVSMSTLDDILRPMRQEGVSFLRPHGDQPIKEADVIDISHEALIRCWQQIARKPDGWLHQEFQDRLIWQSLRVQRNTLSSADAWQRGKWLAGKSETWAERYGGEWSKVVSLVEKSKIRSIIFRSALLIFISIIPILVLGYISYKTEKALRNKAEIYAQKLVTQIEQNSTLSNRNRELEAKLLAEKARKEAENGNTAIALDISRALLENVNGLPDTHLAQVAAYTALIGQHQRLIELKLKSATVDARFSPDGKRIVTASRDNTAHIWDAATGAPIGEPMRHEGIVNAAAFSPDGNRIVTAANDNTARIWNATTGAPIGEPMRHEGIVNAAAFSPDGNRIVTASFDSTARIWSAVTGAAIGKPMKHEDAVNTAAFSPDGERIVTASFDSTARIWSAVTGAAIGKPMKHENVVNTATFSPDGKRIVTASFDSTARIWDAVTGAAIGKPMRHENWISTAAFSPDGDRIVTAATDSTARIWDATAGAAIGEPLRHEDWVLTAAFSPDGNRIVTASNDNTARIWDATTGTPIGKPMRHEGTVYTAAFSPDGNRILTAASDDTARIWKAISALPVDVSGDPRLADDLQSKQDISNLNRTTNRKTARSTDSLNSIGFLVDGLGSMKAVARSKLLDNAVLAWDLSASTTPSRFPISGDTNNPQALTFSDDGRWLASLSVQEFRFEIQLFRLSSAKRYRLIGEYTFDRPSEPPDANGWLLEIDTRASVVRVVSKGIGTELSLPPFEGNTTPLELKGESNTALLTPQPYGAKLLAMRDGKVLGHLQSKQQTGLYTWDMRRPEPRLLMATDIDAPVTFADFDSNGDRFLAIQGGADVRVVSREDGGVIAVLRSQGRRFVAATFDTTGNSVVGLTDRGQMVRWNIFANKARLKQFVGTLNPRTLTDNELLSYLPSSQPTTGDAAEPAVNRRSFKVSIKFAGTFNREEIIRNAKLLDDLGWQVQSAHRGGERTSKAAGLNEVRYSSPQTKFAAEQLARELAGALGNKQVVNVQKIDDSQPAIAPQTLEIWISR